MTHPFFHSIPFKTFYTVPPPHLPQHSIHHSHPTQQPALHHQTKDIYFQQPITTIKILMKQTKQILWLGEQKY